MGQPCSSSQARRARSWSYVVPKSRHSVLILTVVIHPAQTRCQLRCMAINPTTYGMHNLHDVDLLRENHDNGSDVRAPALRCVFPTRDLCLSTWRGAASGTNRFLSGCKTLTLQTVLWLTSWWPLYRKSRAVGGISSGGAQPTVAWMFLSAFWAIQTPHEHFDLLDRKPGFFSCIPVNLFGNSKAEIRKGGEVIREFTE